MFATFDSKEGVIEACKRRLAMDFDTPARTIIEYYGAELGLSYERMVKLLNYVKRKGN